MKMPVTRYHHVQGLRDVDGVPGQEKQAGSVPAEVAHQDLEAPGIEKARTRPKPLRGFQELVKVCGRAPCQCLGIFLPCTGVSGLVLSSPFEQIRRRQWACPENHAHL